LSENKAMKNQVYIFAAMILAVTTGTILTYFLKFDDLVQIKKAETALQQGNTSLGFKILNNVKITENREKSIQKLLEIYLKYKKFDEAIHMLKKIFMN
jgi:hypothetical protein